MSSLRVIKCQHLLSDHDDQLEYADTPLMLPLILPLELPSMLMVVMVTLLVMGMEERGIVDREDIATEDRNKQEMEERKMEIK